MTGQATAELPERADAVITVSQTHAPGTGPQRGTIVEDADAKRKAIREQQHKVLEDTRRQNALAPAEDETPAPNAREDIESLELELPGPLNVIMAPPPGSLTYLIATITAGEKAAGILSQVIKALLFVRLIGGQTPPPIRNMVDVKRWMDDLGDRRLDLLVAALNINWPEPTLADLKVLKKNLRGS